MNKNTMIRKSYLNVIIDRNVLHSKNILRIISSIDKTFNPTMRKWLYE